MSGNEKVRTSRISPRGYLEDYVKHYLKHRSIVAATLMANWDKLPENKRLAHGAHVLIEFGGAIEELFALTFAIYKQCNVPQDTPPEQAEVFFQHLFHYNHGELSSFVRSTRFEDSLEQLFNIPDSDGMAAKFSFTTRYYKTCVTHAEAALEAKKDDFYERDFRSVFNKLKHPFLVLAPEYWDGGQKFVMPLLTKSDDPNMVAKVSPFDMSERKLSVFASDIESISQDLEFIIKLFLHRPWTRPIAHAISTRNEQH